MKKNIFSALSRHSFPGNSPSRDWNAFLAVFAFSVIVSFAFSAGVFLLIRGGGFSTAIAPEAVSSAPLDPEALSGVIRSYEGRGERVENIRTGGEYLVDPSL